jgi:hypothetical protein
VYRVHPHIANERIRLELPHLECEHLVHIRNHKQRVYLFKDASSGPYILKGYGEHIEWGVKVEVVLFLDKPPHWFALFGTYLYRLYGLCDANEDV